MHERIKALREAAAKAVARQNELIDLAAKEARDLTAEEQAEFDACTAKAEKALADIVPLQQVAERSARIDAVQIPAAPVQRDVTGVLSNVTRTDNAPEAPRVFADPKDPDGWKKKLSAYMWASARAKAYPRHTAHEHLANFGCQQLVDEANEAEHKEFQQLADMLGPGRAGDMVRRTLTTLSGAGGDNLVTTPLSTEFIEFLRAESAFMRGGPVMVDMPFGSLTIPGGNAGASGTYHAENADLGYTQATTRQVDMSAKHIGAVTAIGNYLIETSPLAVPAIFGEDLANGIRQGIDSAGLRGDGSGENPTGILSLTNAAHVADIAAFADDGEPTYAEIDSVAKGMLTLLDASLIPRRRRVWQMASRVFRYLQFLRDGNGNYIFPGLQSSAPTWYDGYPVIVSELIPSNLGTGTNESELYLVDYGHVLMGMTRTLRLKSSTEASYKNSGGTLVSAFSKDETVIRAMASHDFGMRHTKAAVIKEAVLIGT